MSANPYLHFDTMTWPHPDDPSMVESRLRYGQPTKTDLLVAASFIAAYRQLVADPRRVRNAKIAGIRRASLVKGDSDGPV